MIYKNLTPELKSNIISTDGYTLKGIVSKTAAAYSDIATIKRKLNFKIWGEGEINKESLRGGGWSLPLRSHIVAKQLSNKTLKVLGAILFLISSIQLDLEQRQSGQFLFEFTCI